MTTFGAGIRIHGEVRAAEDVTVSGRVDGPLTCEQFAVAILPGGSVEGDVIARDVTVSGEVTGQIVATDIAHIRAGANVTGSVITRRIVLEDGATFNGRVEPQHLEAALRVARFNRQKRDTAAG